MRSSTLHYTQLWHGVALACLLTGCWQEIEYTGPDPSTVSPEVAEADVRDEPQRDSSADATPPTVRFDSDDSMASGFAEEVADSPTDRAVPTTPAETTTTVTPADDRYRLPSENGAGQPDSESATKSAAFQETDVPQAANTRRAAWLLGSKLSLAALAHDRGVAAEDVAIWLQEARTSAKILGISVAKLPSRPESDDGPASSQVLNYLLTQGKQAAADSAKHHGVDHAALFEVAMKSNLLRVLYKPGATAVDHISTAIKEAAPRAELPPQLWQPLLDELAKGSPPAAVRAAVGRMHADVDRHLATAVEQ